MTRTGLPLALALALLLAACAGSDATPSDSDDASDSPSDSSPHDTGSNPVSGADSNVFPPIDVSSRSGCATDFDCDDGLICHGGRCLFECDESAHCGTSETCSSIGRCLRQNGLPAIHPTGNDARIDVRTDLSQPARVLPGDTAFDIVLDVQTSDPAGLPLWVERTDEGLLGIGTTPEIIRLQNGRNLVPIPVGAASPNVEDPRPVDILLHTGIGTLAGRMEPRIPAAGTWAAAVEFTQLEGASFDLLFELVTSPPGASLADAERLWIRLFPDPDALLSIHGHAALAPAGPQDVSPSLVRRMTRQQDGTWLATFATEWQPPPDTTGLLDASTVGGTFGRSMRIVFTQGTHDRIEGTLQDRWSGIDGTADEAGFEGSLLAERFGRTDFSPFSDIEVGANRPWTLDPAATSPFAACTADVITDPVFPTECADVLAAGTPPDAAGIRAAAECGLDASLALEAESTAGACIERFLGGDPLALCPVDNMQALAVECSASWTGRPRAEFAPPGFGVDDGTPATLCAPEQLARHACAAEFIGVAAATATRRGQVLAPAEALPRWVDEVRHSAVPLDLIAAGLGAELRFRWFDVSPPGANRVGWDVLDGQRRALIDEVDEVAAIRMASLRLTIGRHAIPVLDQLRTTEVDDEAVVVAVQGMLGAWQLALDELQYAAQRKSMALASDSGRQEAWAEMQQRGLELYMAAHVLRRAARLLPRDDADLIRALVARGFGEFENATSLLRLTVAELRNQRDGEVARFTGIDGEEVGVVAQRAQRAQQLLTRLDGMAARLGDERSNTLDDALLGQRDAAARRSLQEQLALMCGVDLGRCAPGSEPELLRCEPLVGPERCGMPILDGELSSEVQNVSEVARAIGGVMRGALGVELALEEHRAFQARVALEEQRLRTFADFSDEWMRLAVGNADAWMDSIVEEQSLLAEAGQIRSQRGFWDRVQSIANTASTVIGGVTRGVDFLTGNSTAREILSSLTSERFVDSTRGFFDLDPVGSDSGDGEGDEGGEGSQMVMGETHRVPLTQLGLSALTHDELDRMQAAAAMQGYMRRVSPDLEAIPLDEREKFIGAVTAGLKVVSTVAGIFGRRAQAKREKRAAEKEAQARQVAMRRDYERMLREAQLQNLQNEQEIADRQLVLKQMLEDSAGYLIRIQQAENEVDRLVDEVLAMQSRADLIAQAIDQLAADERARDAIRHAPHRYFDRIGALYEAEEVFEAARQAIFDYLVAVEYAAVRPFFSARDRLIRARTWTELRQVADDLDEARQFCGGQTSSQSDSLSLRRDVLRIREAVRNPATGESVSETEQFRAALERAHFARETVTSQDPRFVRRIFDALRAGQLLALRFELKLDEFSNLFAVCNARVSSVSAELVGDLGEGSPAVVLVYDGHGVLESCHDERIMADWESTQFGPRTMLVTQPVNSTATVTVNRAPEAGTGNRSLNGLPVAGRYTLFIETAAGGNRSVDWSGLEDIVLHVTYSYQNFFPETERCSL